MDTKDNRESHVYVVWVGDEAWCFTENPLEFKGQLKIDDKQLQGRADESVERKPRYPVKLGDPLPPYRRHG